MFAPAVRTDLILLLICARMRSSAALRAAPWRENHARRRRKYQGSAADSP